MGEAIKIAPYVAFFPEPATAQSRFLIQGYVDREEIAAAVEALEDDDPAGQCTEDEISCGGLTYAWHPSGPGCEISDPGGTHGLDC